MMKNTFSIRKVTGFLLKIIAMVSMTIDHTGIFLADYNFGLSEIFRCIGRLALPLFIFLIAEGVEHTKNEIKYLLRLGILAITFAIGQIFALYVLDLELTSPIVDLFVAALTLILLKRKDKFSWFAIIPIAYTIVCFVFANLPNVNNFIPLVLRPDYVLFSLLLALGFFYSKPLSILILKSNTSTTNLIDTSYQRYTQTILSALWVVILSGIFYVSYILFGVSYTSMPYQIFSMFSCIPILLYSGKRGYNKKWFQIGCYIYVPLHILVIALIFVLI